MRTLPLLSLIGVSLGSSPAVAQTPPTTTLPTTTLPIEQRIKRIVEWVKADPESQRFDTGSSGSETSYYCGSEDSPLYFKQFKSGEKEFFLRYCDSSDNSGSLGYSGKGQAGLEDTLIIHVDFPRQVTDPDGKKVNRTGIVDFYDGALNGFHPERAEWLPSEYHGGSTHKECVFGWLGTEYVGHLEVGGTSSNPEQDRKDQQKAQQQYLLVLEQIESYIATSNSTR